MHARPVCLCPATAQAAVQAGRLNVVAALSLGKEMEDEVARVTEATNETSGSGRRRSRVRRRSITSTTVAESTVGRSPTNRKVSMKSDLRSAAYVLRVVVVVVAVAVMVVAVAVFVLVIVVVVVVVVVVAVFLPSCLNSAWR